MAENMLVAIPGDIENMQLPNPELLQYYKDMDNRVIWVDSEIDESVLEISKKIIDINRMDKDIPVEQRKPIKLLIYSYGGDGNACFSLIDTIEMSKTPIYTFNMGVAMSAAFLILLSGKRRFCTKSSTALAHSGSGGAQGSFEQTEAAMQDYKKFVENMRNFILSHTKIDTKTFNKYKSKEWYIYSDKQKELGIVDEIIESIDDVL